MATPSFPTLDDLEPGTRVLARLDLNSPVHGGEVEDNRRFIRHAETVRELAAADHRVVLLAHQGRPGDADFVSLEQHATILSEHVDRDVAFCAETVGDTASTAAEELDRGEILLLENVRMESDELEDRTPEEHAESTFVTELATYGDAYVGDAYSAAHRSHATIVGLPLAMETAVAGRVMEAEYTANSAIQSRTFEGEVTMVLGGTKADDLFRVIEGVDETVETFLLGGVIGELCLRAAGHDLGYDVETDLFDELWDEYHTTISELVSTLGERLVLPSDLAYADADGARIEAPVAGSTKTAPYFDIGQETIETFTAVISRSDAVFVKGALGVFEDERFADGTIEVLRAIGESDAFSVVGGGDTSRALDIYDELDPANFDHLSIAGGAYVRALAGESLPGVEVLRRADQ